MVIGKQCRPRLDATECGIWSRSPLFVFANSSAIFLQEYRTKSNSLTYLKLKLESSNILCGRVHSVYNGLMSLTTGKMVVFLKLFFSTVLILKKLLHWLRNQKSHVTSKTIDTSLLTVKGVLFDKLRGLYTLSRFSAIFDRDNFPTYQPHSEMCLL